MRDKSHIESIERWANYIKKNPKWKKIHSDFINSQFAKAYVAIKKLSVSREGREKIKKLYGIKNEKGYPELLKHYRAFQIEETLPMLV